MHGSQLLLLEAAYRYTYTQVTLGRATLAVKLAATAYQPVWEGRAGGQKIRSTGALKSAFFYFDTIDHKFEMDLGRLAPSSEVTGSEDIPNNFEKGMVCQF
jgi:hypothetical protein